MFEGPVPSIAVPSSVSAYDPSGVAWTNPAAQSPRNSRSAMRGATPTRSAPPPGTARCFGENARQVHVRRYGGKLKPPKASDGLWQSASSIDQSLVVPLLARELVQVQERTRGVRFVAAQKRQAGVGRCLYGSQLVLVAVREEPVFDHSRCSDESRHEYVHTDTIAVKGGGEAGGESLQGRFADAVEDRVVSGVQAGVLGRVRRDVQDPPGSVCAHSRQESLGEIDTGGQLDLQHS